MTPSDGWLAIEGLRFHCIIGVGERERQRPREIVADLHVRVDFGRAAASDSIHDAVDYRALTQRLVAAGESTRFRLVEALASHLVRVILDEFPGVHEARVEVEKPGALRNARSVRAIASARRAIA